MPAIFQSAKPPRRESGNTVSERFEAGEGALVKSKTPNGVKDGKLFQSLRSGGSDQLPAQAILVFPSLPLPPAASQGYSYHNIYWIPIRLQDSERLLAI